MYRNPFSSFLCFIIFFFDIEVPPIDQKRMVAFINEFIITTVSFLNDFMTNIETKFVEFELKLQKIEASLMIVEAKVVQSGFEIIISMKKKILL